MSVTRQRPNRARSVTACRGALGVLSGLECWQDWRCLSVCLSVNTSTEWLMWKMHCDAADYCKYFVFLRYLKMCVCVSHQTGWSALIASILLTSPPRDWWRHRCMSVLCQHPEPAFWARLLYIDVCLASDECSGSREGRSVGYCGDTRCG